MKTYKRIGWLLVFALVTLGTTVTDAQFTASVAVKNTSGTALTDVHAHFPLSSQVLVDNNFLDSDALNMELKDSTDTDVIWSPAPAKTDLTQGILDDGGTATDETTDITDAGVKDVSLLPAVPVVDDAFYFCGDYPFRILELEIGQAGSAGTDWALAWEYNNGSNWILLSDIQDPSDDFRSLGTHEISYTMPNDMAKVNNGIFESDLTPRLAHHNYCIRSRVTDAGAAPYIQPFGDRAYYDIGNGFQYLPSMASNETYPSTLHTGFTNTDKDFHWFIPGSGGILLRDSISDPSDDDTIAFDGYVNTDASSDSNNKYIVYKGNALAIAVGGTDEVIEAYVWDGVGTATTTVLPDEDVGAVNFSSTCGTGSHYACIDDDPHDGDGTYNYTTSATPVFEIYKFADSALTQSDSVSTVTVTATAKQVAGSGKMRLCVTSKGIEGNAVCSADFTMGAAYGNVTLVNPLNHTRAFMPDAFDSGNTEDGIEVLVYLTSDGTNQLRLTAVKVEIVSEAADITLTATGVASGEHLIALESDSGGGTHKLYIDTVEEDSDTNTVPDNTFIPPWTIAPNDAVMYMEFARKFDTSSTLEEFRYEYKTFEIATLMQDQDAGGTDDGIPFWAAPNTNILPSIGSLSPPASAFEVGASSGDVVDPISGDSAEANTFATTTAAVITNPLSPAVNQLASVGGVPAQAFWIIFGLFATVGAMLITFRFMPHPMMVMMAGGFVMGGLVVMAIFPWWIIFVWALFAAAVFLFIGKGISVGV